MKQDKKMMAGAVHKHEKALHPGKPMTKFAKGGKTDMDMMKYIRDHEFETQTSNDRHILDSIGRNSEIKEIDQEYDTFDTPDEKHTKMTKI